MVSFLALLLPALFPSWRFFQDVGPSPVVEVLINGRWAEARPRPAKLEVGQIALSLLWNRACAERLYLTSCAERFLAEPSDRLLGQIIALLPKEASAFRICLRARFRDEITQEVAFESPMDAL